MPTLDCYVEDSDVHFLVDIDEMPRTGEFLARADKTYVISSVTWQVMKRTRIVKLTLRELPPPP